MTSRVASEALLEEAGKSRVDAVSGDLLCLTCGKALADRAKLAQHLKDAHKGVNAPPPQHAQPAGRSSKPSCSFSLADVLEAKLRRSTDAARPASPAKAQPAPPPAKPRGVQGTLKLNMGGGMTPEEAVLCGTERSNAARKRPTAVKRAVLKARAASTAAQAAADGTAKAGALAAARAAAADVQLQYEAAVAAQGAGGSAANSASVCTQVQVLDLARAEASRRVTEAETALQASQDAATETAERLQAWAVAPPEDALDAVEVTDEEVAELVLSSSHSAQPEGGSQTLDASAAVAAAQSQLPAEHQASAALPRAAAQPAAGTAAGSRAGVIAGPGGELSDADSDAGSLLGYSESGISSNSDDGAGPGLSGFQDVLSSWATAAALPKPSAWRPGKPDKPAAAAAGYGKGGVAVTPEAATAPVAAAHLRAETSRDAQPADWRSQPSPAASSSKNSHSSAESNVASWLAGANLVGHSQGPNQSSAMQSTQAAAPAAAAATPDWLADSDSDEEADQDTRRRPSAAITEAPGTPSQQSGTLLAISSSEAAASAAPSQVSISQVSASSASPPRSASLPPRPGIPAGHAAGPSLQTVSAPAGALGALLEQQQRQLRLPPPNQQPHPQQPHGPGFSGFSAPVGSSNAPGVPLPPWVHPVSQGSATPEQHPPLSLRRSSGSADSALRTSSMGPQPQVLQQQRQLLSLQPMGLSIGHPAAGSDPQLHTAPHPFAAHAAAGDWQQLQQPPAAQDNAGASEYLCELCSVRVSGARNMSQHLSSARHMRRAANAARGIAAAAVSAHDGAGAQPAAAGQVSLQRGQAAAGGPALLPIGDYCQQVITEDIDRCAAVLLHQLLQWQERARAARDARSGGRVAAKKRLVSGLREVAKWVRVGKARAVIVAPNIEPAEGEAGLSSLLGGILGDASARGIPVVFALSRKRMGQIFGWSKKMSAIALLDVSGADAAFSELVTRARAAAGQWAAEHPGSAAPAMATVATPPPQEPELQLQHPAAQGIELLVQRQQHAMNPSPVPAAAAFGIAPLLQQEQARRDFERQLSAHQMERQLSAQLSTQLSTQLSAQMSMRQPPPPPPPPQHQQLEGQLSSQLSAQLSAQLSGHPLQPPPPPQHLWQAHSAVPASQLRTATQPLYPNASAVPGLRRGPPAAQDFVAQSAGVPPPHLQQVPDALAGIAEAAAAAAVQQYAAADAARQRETLHTGPPQGRRMLSAASAPGFGGAEALLSEQTARAAQLLPAAGGGSARHSFDMGLQDAEAWRQLQAAQLQRQQQHEQQQQQQQRLDSHPSLPLWAHQHALTPQPTAPPALMQRQPPPPPLEPALSAHLQQQQQRRRQQVMQQQPQGTHLQLPPQQRQLLLEMEAQWRQQQQLQSMQSGEAGDVLNDLLTLEKRKPSTDRYPWPPASAEPRGSEFSPGGVGQSLPTPGMSGSGFSPQGILASGSGGSLQGLVAGGRQQSAPVALQQPRRGSPGALAFSPTQLPQIGRKSSSSTIERRGSGGSGGGSAGGSRHSSASAMMGAACAGSPLGVPTIAAASATSAASSLGAPSPWAAVQPQQLWAARQAALEQQAQLQQQEGGGAAAKPSSRLRSASDALSSSDPRLEDLHLQGGDRSGSGGSSGHQQQQQQHEHPPPHPFAASSGFGWGGSLPPSAAASPPDYARPGLWQAHSAPGPHPLAPNTSARSASGGQAIGGSYSVVPGQRDFTGQPSGFGSSFGGSSLGGTARTPTPTASAGGGNPGFGNVQIGGDLQHLAALWDDDSLGLLSDGGGGGAGMDAQQRPAAGTASPSNPFANQRA